MTTQSIFATALATGLVAASAACAQDSQPGREATVEIKGHYDNAIGTSDAASQGAINAALLKSRPALRPGEVLEFVPGLIVTQHSGDGKANQYFLRGFNLDHGTDFATTVAGIPVNMPTHGHGQGYTDLNFLIPEMVQRIDYRKGPYFATHGDFASAGAADIVYRQRFDAPESQLTLGENGYRRAFLGGSGMAAGVRVLGALELLRNDGPWSVPERMRKTNGVITLSGGTAAEGWSASVMGYDASWTSTDQIPERLIRAGRIGRFDSLDDTTGGRTSRRSVSGEWHRAGAAGTTRIAAYALRYQLDLYSNFTYGLERPDSGDQFAQRDKRDVFGLRASHGVGHELAGWPARTELGIQVRDDAIRVGLFDTQARAILSTRREDEVRETLVGLYGQSALEFSRSLRAVVGLRADRVINRVQALTDPANGGRVSDSLVSPKLSVIAGPFGKTELFANAGRGFHSNDARGTTDALAPVPALVASKGWELGVRTEALAGLQSSLALWKLDVDSELVYVGDAGATEPSTGSRRTGIEWNNRYVPVPGFLVDADFAWTHARFANGDRIPNAIDRVASIAVTWRDVGAWTTSLQWRYLGTGALIEDNSVRSRSSLTTNLRVSRRLGAGAEMTLDVFNLLDRDVDDIQYFYESQVPGESAPVADRHLHPAEPRNLRLTLRLTF
jgi:hypothetical protein